MKRSIAVLACAVLSQFLVTQEASAFPGERIVQGAANVAHKAAYGINHHVVQPARRVVVRHTPG